MCVLSQKSFFFYARITSRLKNLFLVPPVIHDYFCTFFVSQRHVFFVTQTGNGIFLFFSKDSKTVDIYSCYSSYHIKNSERIFPVLVFVSATFA